MTSFSESELSAAIKCYEEAVEADPRVSPWAIYSHLEHRCVCFRDRRENAISHEALVPNRATWK